MPRPYVSSIENLYCPPPPVHDTNYIFQVVTKINRIYTPISIVHEIPLDENSWKKPVKPWVAERILLIHNFLSNKDPAARCRLEAEKKWVLDVTRQRRLWHRHDAVNARWVARNTSARLLELQDPRRMANPYTACGILDCLGQQVSLEENIVATLLQQPSVWAPNSLQLSVDPLSDFTIVVFDITDLDDIKTGIIELPLYCERREDRRLVTMEKHCADEFGWYNEMEKSAITFIRHLPRLEDLTVLQLVWSDQDLKLWAKEYAALPKVRTVRTPEVSLAERALTRYDEDSDFSKAVLCACFPRDGNLTSFFEDQCSKIRDDSVAGLILSWLYSPDLSLVAAKGLTMEQLLQGLRHQSVAICKVTLSFSARLLVESTLEQRHALIQRLILLNGWLEWVYITDPPIQPAINQATADVRNSSREAQAQFLEQIRREFHPLWRKVQCSSVYTWKLSNMLHRVNIMDPNIADILRSTVAEPSYSTQVSSIRSNH